MIIACDASPYGLGAVLSNIMPDKSERPIMVTSRTLKNAERNYSQIEKEALVIIFAVKKFSSVYLWTNCYDSNGSYTTPSFTSRT